MTQQFLRFLVTAHRAEHRAVVVQDLDALGFDEPCRLELLGRGLQPDLLIVQYPQGVARLQVGGVLDEQVALHRHRLLNASVSHQLLRSPELLSIVYCRDRPTLCGHHLEGDGNTCPAFVGWKCGFSLLGIMLDRLTNGLRPTGIHRVAAKGPGERYSVIQFCHPTPWTMLAPIPTCVTAENPLRYPTIMVGDLLDQVIWEINMVESGRRLND